MKSHAQKVAEKAVKAAGGKKIPLTKNSFSAKKAVKEEAKKK